MTSEMGSIDAAIVECRQKVVEHRKTSWVEAGVGAAIFGLAVWGSSSVIASYAGAKATKERAATQKIEMLQGMAKVFEERRKELAKNPHPAPVVTSASSVPTEEEQLIRQQAEAEVLMRAARSELADVQSEQPVPALAYVTQSLVLLSLAGIVVGLYRYHLKEISRLEKFELGLMRIRIAGNNFDNEGFRTEVRAALASGAFDSPPSGALRDGKIESPVPGHPSSDLGAAFLNKLLEAVEFVAKPKKASSD